MDAVSGSPAVDFTLAVCTSKKAWNWWLCSHSLLIIHSAFTRSIVLFPLKPGVQERSIYFSIPPWKSLNHILIYLVLSALLLLHLQINVSPAVFAGVQIEFNTILKTQTDWVLLNSRCVYLSDCVLGFMLCCVFNKPGSCHGVKLQRNKSISDDWTNEAVNWLKTTHEEKFTHKLKLDFHFWATFSFKGCISPSAHTKGGSNLYFWHDRGQKCLHAVCDSVWRQLFNLHRFNLCVDRALLSPRKKVDIVSGWWHSALLDVIKN